MIDADKEQAKRAEQFWGAIQTAPAERGYWNHPYLDRISSGKMDGKWFLEYAIDKYFNGRPAESCLSLGCGAGEVDRLAYKKGVYRKLHGLDFSTEGLKVAVAHAATEGVPATYSRADFNFDKIPSDEKYDLIYDYACFHHVSNLDNIMASVDAHLADNGYFVMYGYCGPARMQWSPQVMRISNNLLRRLPIRLRQAMPELVRHSVWEYMAADPSEGVRGTEVIDLLRAYFDVIEEINIGYTLSHPMLAPNAGHFDPNNSTEQAIFRAICQFESILVSEGILNSDVKVMISRRRKSDPFRPEGL